jgi:hypothetical protein
LTASGEVYTIFDTASTELLISDLWFESVVDAYMTAQGLSYQTVNGTVYYTCQATELAPLDYGVGGYWLQMDGADLSGEVEFANYTGCFLKIKGIDAPFNVLPSQAYTGYYIEHNYAEGTITVTPHGDSRKPSLAAAVGAAATLEIRMFSEDIENGDLYALGLAVFGTVFAAIVGGYYLYTEWDTQSGQYWAGVIGAGVVGLVIGFFILRWFLLLMFMPGNVIWEVTPADDAVVTVEAMGGRLTILGLISAALMKIYRKAPAAVEQESETAVTEAAPAEDDTQTNSLE